MIINDVYILLHSAHTRNISTNDIPKKQMIHEMHMHCHLSLAFYKTVLICSKLYHLSLFEHVFQWNKIPSLILNKLTFNGLTTN